MLSKEAEFDLPIYGLIAFLGFSLTMLILLPLHATISDDNIFVLSCAGAVAGVVIALPISARRAAKAKEKMRNELEPYPD